MARRAAAYPQVDPRAAGLVDRAVTSAGARARVGEALARARQRDAAAVRAGEQWILREDLARAAALGLTDLPARALARPLPVVAPGTPEVAVRRHLLAGAPLVIVADRRSAAAVAPLGTEALLVPGGRRLGQMPAAVRDVLTTIGRVAGRAGARAWLVGGVVRDVLGGRVDPPRDLDVVVEGDGLAVARALAAALGGVAIEHERFLTASVRAADRRIDVATARAERYDVPGALPRVVPAAIREDLGRRDFTINAMAVELESGTWSVLDAFGGRADLARRRVRVLHPLSFVEDPTRIFRAARYAARLGFAPDAWTARARALALSLAPYPALSGSRVLAEIDLILRDAHPPRALARLGTSGAYRLIDPRYRWTPATARRVAALAATRAWARERGLSASGVELAVLAILADQPEAVGTAGLGRLGFSGEPRHRRARALVTRRPLAGALARAQAPSATAALLRDRSDVELAWLWLAGGRPARAAVDWFVAQGRAASAALRGDEVIALGVPAGPAVATILRTLRDARLDGRIGDRPGEIEYVRRWITTREEG
jgi:tRNA nucleotidyltransferase (CCA-adding enzyme)